jgi:hypothetical protein
MRSFVFSGTSAETCCSPVDTWGVTVEIKTVQRAGRHVKCPLVLSGFDKNCNVSAPSAVMLQVPAVMKSRFRARECVVTCRLTDRQECEVIKRLFSV